MHGHSLSLEVGVEGLGGQGGKEGAGQVGEGKQQKVVSSNRGTRSVLRCVSRAWGGRRGQVGWGKK